MPNGHPARLHTLIPQLLFSDCARKGKVMLEDELKDASSAVREGGLSDIARSKKRAPIDPDLAALQKLRLIDKLMGVSFKACLGIHRVLQDLNVSQFRVHKVREPHARRSTDLFGNGGFKPYPTPVLDAGRSVAATEVCVDLFIVVVGVLVDTTKAISKTLYFDATQSRKCLKVYWRIGDKLRHAVANLDPPLGRGQPLFCS